MCECVYVCVCVCVCVFCVPLYILSTYFLEYTYVQVSHRSDQKILESRDANYTPDVQKLIECKKDIEKNRDIHT